MATDTLKIIQNLLAVYDFKDRTIIVVGGGGGQFIEYGRSARQILAVDNDPAAIQKLRENLKKAGLEDKFTPIPCDFYEVHLKGDGVLFEFCLHEMSDPEAAVRHAQTMAPEVIIIDHWPGSEWLFYTAEEGKVARSWDSLESFAFKRREKYDTVHIFRDYEEIWLKLKDLGEPSLSRIEKFRSQKDFSIRVSYSVAVI